MPRKKKTGKKKPWYMTPYTLVLSSILVVGIFVYIMNSGGGTDTRLTVKTLYNGVISPPDRNTIYVDDNPYSATSGAIIVDVTPGTHTYSATMNEIPKSDLTNVVDGDHVTVSLEWTNGDGYSPSEDFNNNKLGSVVLRGQSPYSSGHALRGAVIYSGGRFHVWYSGHDGSGYYHLLYAEVSDSLEVIRTVYLGDSLQVPWTDRTTRVQWGECHACVVEDMILLVFVAKPQDAPGFWSNTHLGFGFIYPSDYTTIHWIENPFYLGDGTAGNPGIAYHDGHLYVYWCEGIIVRNVYMMSTPYSRASPETFSWSSIQQVTWDYNPGGMITDWTPYYVYSLGRWEVYARARGMNHIYCWYSETLDATWTYVGNPIEPGVTIGGRVAQNMDVWGDKVYHISGVYYLWYGLNVGGTDLCVATGRDR